MGQHERWTQTTQVCTGKQVVWQRCKANTPENRWVALITPDLLGYLVNNVVFPTHIVRKTLKGDSMWEPPYVITIWFCSIADERCEYFTHSRNSENKLEIGTCLWELAINLTLRPLYININTIRIQSRIFVKNRILFSLLEFCFESRCLSIIIFFDNTFFQNIQNA